MKCYLIRHGQDDDSVRGGWSTSPLTNVGIQQVRDLAKDIYVRKVYVDTIYTSDLVRARETADILSNVLNVPVIELPQFRETNNGVLAGMDNTLANELYPGLYWSALDWDQCYPNGESPRTFYDRVSKAWVEFKENLKNVNKDVILVTHGGVINVILCIENKLSYSNKSHKYIIKNAEMIGIEV